MKGFGGFRDQTARNTKCENETIENRTMKKILCSLVAVLSLASAALADQTPDHKVLVLKNKDDAAILGYDAVG